MAQSGPAVGLSVKRGHDQAGGLFEQDPTGCTRMCPGHGTAPLLPRELTLNSSLSEHANYFGVDEKLGPVAVSIKREKLEDHKEHGPQYQYRIIFRTREVGRITVVSLRKS